MADPIEVTKEIILKMIEHNKILPSKIDPSSTNHAADTNKNYNQELDKAFRSVYKTVSDTWNGK